jgi:uncharacterized protein (TIGR03435 family)
VTFADLSPWANHLWQSTLFAAVAWLLTLALRKNRAAVRYWVWLAASVKFLIPFSLLVSAGAQLGWRTAPAAVQPRFSFVMEEIAQPFAAAAPTPVPAVAAAALNQLPAILFGIWLCGVAIGAVFWLWWWRRIRAIRRAATPLPLNLPIRVMSSTARLEPGVVGIVKPVLLLPEGITDRLTPPQLEAILAHELRHVQRRDNLTAAIHMVVETLFWFHPLVWWIRGRLVEERELACDEGVLRLGSEPQVYAESILKVCEFYLASPVACAAGVTGGELKKRIEGIMENRYLRSLSLGKKILLAVAGLMAVGTPIVVGVMASPPSHARSRVLPAAATAPLLALAASPPALQQSQGPQTPAAVTAPRQSAPAAGPLADTHPAFEVASIKPAAPQQPGMMVSMGGDAGRINYTNVSLKSVLMRAYDVKLYQITGPSWLDTERYDIIAKVPDGAPKEQIPAMLRDLLAERFHTTVHREIKTAPVYALVVGRNGPRLKDADPTLGPSFVIQADEDAFEMIGRLSLALLASNLSARLGRPVLDLTELKGTYNIDMKWARDEMGGSTVAGDAHSTASTPFPSIFSALQESLGLKLEPRTAPVEYIVVDKAEKVPTEN